MRNQAQYYPVAVSIWLLALGYFAFYIPYSALIKALSSGLLANLGVSGSAQILAPSAFLPWVLLGTVLTMPLIIYALGWYAFFNGENNRFRRQNLFTINRWAVGSGLAFAVIIATTTLAYSFVGVSIVFALLLMRGGVLVMSPLVDHFSGRQVHWYSWGGLMLSLFAVALALAQAGEYQLAPLVLLNLAAYLGGYIFRLRQMSHYAKDAQESVNRQFFVQENTVAMLALLIFAALTLVFHLSRGQVTFTDYIALMVSSKVIYPAMLIGFFYGILGIFGSLIYLNRRENTFAIPVNRCASLLSGVCASLILYFFFAGQSPSSVQLISAFTICLALFVMSFFDSKQISCHPHSVENPMQRIWLFICNGNRMRSPMAAAICNKVLERHFQQQEPDETARDIYAESAALQLGEKRFMPDAAKAALADFHIELKEHRAQQVTEEHIHRAEKIYCMNEQQCKALIALFPWTAPKVVNLGGETDIAKPEGTQKQHFITLANVLHQHILGVLTAAVGKEKVTAFEPGLERNNV
ncbi:low molecular weight phosphatase family protein [Thalassomonas viridans]|uniref:Low molecular weight phosphatase family protein n=1 Tax=Thalassomonas viridans TaxID=137584 RepID=A0AAF0CCD7_9GAMM|nr:low molecular weight phosphatase family protein [Thalassomonas viridans]WDE08026.1 low molecular weight phosphatase family protein [Thalassomonas viridans]